MMSSAFEDSLLDFDLSAFQPSSNNAVVCADRVGKAIKKTKRKIITTDVVVNRYRHAVRNYKELEKSLISSKEEHKQACIDVIEYREKCLALEKVIKDLQLNIKNLELNCVTAQNKHDGMRSHAKQLEQLVKQNETRIESLKIENLSEKAINAKLQKENDQLSKNMCYMRSFVFGKKKLPKGQKSFVLTHVKKSPDDALDCEEIRCDDVNTFDEVLSPDFEIHNDKLDLALQLGNLSENKNTSGSELRSFDINEGSTYARVDHDHDEDDGRGSSIACSDSDKCFNSPEYFINSPFTGDFLRSKNKLSVNVSTSPVNDVKHVATSPIIFENLNILDGKEKNVSNGRTTQEEDCDNNRTRIMIDRVLSPIFATRYVDVSTSPLNSTNDAATSLLKQDGMSNCNNQQDDQNTQEKHLMEINNSTCLEDENSNDCEVQMIFDSMRFSQKLITPIPTTPGKSRNLEAPTDTATQTMHTDFVSIAVVKVLQKNIAYLFTTVAELKENVDMVMSKERAEKTPHIVSGDRTVALTEREIEDRVLVQSIAPMEKSKAIDNNAIHLEDRVLKLKKLNSILFADSSPPSPSDAAPHSPTRRSYAALPSPPRPTDAAAHSPLRPTDAALCPPQRRSDAAPLSPLRSSFAAPLSPPRPSDAALTSPPSPSDATLTSPPRPRYAARRTPPSPSDAALTSPPSPSDAALTSPPSPSDATLTSPPRPRYAARRTPPSPSDAALTSPPSPSDAALTSPPSPSDATLTSPPRPRYAARRTPPSPSDAALTSPPSPSDAALTSPPSPSVATLTSLPRSRYAARRTPPSPSDAALTSPPSPSDAALSSPPSPSDATLTSPPRPRYAARRTPPSISNAALLSMPCPSYSALLSPPWPSYAALRSPPSPSDVALRSPPSLSDAALRSPPRSSDAALPSPPRSTDASLTSPPSPSAVALPSSPSSPLTLEENNVDNSNTYQEEDICLKENERLQFEVPISSRGFVKDRALSNTDAYESEIVIDLPPDTLESDTKSLHKILNKQDSKHQILHEELPNKKITKKKNNSKLEKMRQKMLPKSKIKYVDEQVKRRKSTQPKRLNTNGERISSSQISHNTAYEKACKVIAELRSKEKVQNKDDDVTVLIPKLSLSLKKGASKPFKCSELLITDSYNSYKNLQESCIQTQNQGIGPGDLSQFNSAIIPVKLNKSSKPIYEISNTTQICKESVEKNKATPELASTSNSSLPRQRIIRTRSQSKSMSHDVSMTQKSEIRSDPGLPPLSPRMYGINRRQSNVEESLIRNNTIVGRLIKSDIVTVTEESNGNSDAKRMASRTTLKRKSVEVADFAPKRMLRSSSVRNDSKEPQSKRVIEKNEEIISRTRKEMVTYGDIDIFEETEKLTNEQVVPRAKKYSVFCHVLDRYCRKSKMNATKLSENAINFAYKKIEDGIADIRKLPHGKDQKVAMNKLVMNLHGLKQKQILAGIIKFLKEPARKIELQYKTYLTMAPPLTEAESILIYVVSQFKVYWPDIVENIMIRIEHTLFMLNRSPDCAVIETLAHFYAVLCRYFDKRKRMRMFLMDAMYSMQFKSLYLIKQCMEVDMKIFPLAHMVNAKAPLVTCLVYLLHFFKCDDKNNILQDIRNLFHRKYFYDMSDWNEPRVLETFRNSIMRLSDVCDERKMLTMAFILLAKRNGALWCQNNIIQNMLLPIIEQPRVPDRVKHFCVSLLGPLLKPYPMDMKVNCEIVINQLFAMLSRNQSDKMVEAIFTSLIHMSKHNPNRVIKALVFWKPERISPEMEQLLINFAKERSLKSWRTFISNFSVQQT